MPRLRKTLPRDFDELLLSASLQELEAVLERCELGARGDHPKRTALATAECRDDLAAWLVARGEDVNAADIYGNTGLHARAVRYGLPLGGLLDLGADIEARNTAGNTPLLTACAAQKPQHVAELLAHHANAGAVENKGRNALDITLDSANNASLEEALQISRLLLAAGLEVSPAQRIHVAQLGEKFEFYRADFAQDSVQAVASALDGLYALFSVDPVPQLHRHDGVSDIEVPEGAWPQAHDALWAALVPGSGHAPTVQGELIRISGRLGNELLGNGGVNWDRDFKRMVAAFLRHVESGNSLSSDDLEDVASAAAELHPGIADKEPLQYLCRSAVEWVRLNPTPIPLPEPAYRR